MGTCPKLEVMDVVVFQGEEQKRKGYIPQRPKTVPTYSFIFSQVLTEALSALSCAQRTPEPLSASNQLTKPSPTMHAPGLGLYAGVDEHTVNVLCGVRRIHYCSQAA